MPAKPTPPLASQKSTTPPASDGVQQKAPKPQAAAPPPEKIPLEASIKKTVSDRRDVLTINLRKEKEDDVRREEEMRVGKERIAVIETEIAEIDAFLARS